MDSAVLVAIVGAIPLTITALAGLAASRRAAAEKRAADDAERRRVTAEEERSQHERFIEQQAEALSAERTENARLRAELAAALTRKDQA